MKAKANLISGIAIPRIAPAKVLGISSRNEKSIGRKGTFMGRRMKSLALLAVGMIAASGLAFASPAAAGGSNSTSLSGTVNCNGSVATYTNVRRLTGYSTTDLYLRGAAWSQGYPWTGNYTSMTLGVRITKTGKNLDKQIVSADRWLTFDTRPYLPNTAFVMRAAMHASVGACHNTWSGTLFY
jgi:hypothetical protein